VGRDKCGTDVHVCGSATTAAGRLAKVGRGVKQIFKLIINIYFNIFMSIMESAFPDKILVNAVLLP